MQSRLTYLLTTLSIITLSAFGVFVFLYLNDSSYQDTLEDIQQILSEHSSSDQTLLPHANFVNLKDEIREILGNRKSRFGIYIYDLKRQQEIAINAEKIFPPASISKVPAALLVLRDIDAGIASYKDTFPVKAKNKPYNYGVMYNYKNGRRPELREYLTRSIVESDNTAHWSIEDYLGGYQEVNRRTVDELEVNAFFRAPHIATAKDIGLVFQNIYYGTYLSPEINQFMLKLLNKTSEHLQDGIPAKLPANTKVAHKTGQLPFYVWEDAGIVYGPTTDFVIVFLNKDITYRGARQKIQNISLKVYEELNQL